MISLNMIQECEDKSNIVSESSVQNTIDLLQERNLLSCSGFCTYY